MKYIRRAEALGAEAAGRRAEAARRELAFLSGMKVRSAQAALSDGYLEKWLNGAMRATGRGYLTLIREEYCSFGMQLMAKLPVALAQQKMLSAKEAAGEAKEGILKDKGLLDEWMKACEGNEHLRDTPEKKKVFVALAKKAANARFCGERRAYREEFAARGSKGNTGCTTRGELKVYVRKK